MTPVPPPPARRAATTLCALGLLCAAVLGPVSAPAAQLTWGPGGAGGSGTWDDGTTADWYNGTSNVVWTDNDTALFAGTAGTVSIYGSVTTPQVTFTTAGYTLQNFFLEGAASGLTVETDADATISASIFGASPYNTPFTKTGSGVLTLTGQGPVFFGSANINAGEMRFTGTGSPEFNVPYVLANAAGVALTFSASSNEIGSLGGGGATGGVVRPYVTSGKLNLTIYGSGDATFGGTIQDNGSATLSFTKSGTSVQTLTGANTYSGATTVNGGTLISGGTTSTLSSTLVLAGANGSALNTASVAVSYGGILRLDNSAASNGQRLASNVAVNLSGGTLSLVGNATTDTTQTVGAVGFSQAATVGVTPAGTAAAQLVLSSLTRQNNGTISFSDGGHVTATGLTNTNGIAPVYATVNGTDWATVDAGGRVSAFTGYTSDPAASNAQSNLRLTTANGAVTTLANATNAFNSLNLVNSGTASATLDLGAGHALALTSGGLLSSGSAAQTIRNGTLTAVGSELIVTNQNALTISSVIADAATATGVTKSGAGTLALIGTNTYTGPTTVVQGTVQAAADANLGAGGAVALSGGTLQATAAFTSAKSLQGTGGTLDTQGYNVAFNGGGNTGSVTKVGAGMLSLTGTVANVTLVAGTVRLSNLAQGNAASVSLYGGRLEATGSGVGSVFFGGNSGELSPGSIGQAASLTIGSLMVFASTATVDFDLGSSATDSLTLTSPSSLFGAQNQSVLFRFSDLGGTRTGTAYPLLYLPANSFGVNAAEFGIDSVSTAAGYRGSFTLSNNVLSVTFTAVPEPGAAGWLLLGALGVWAGRAARSCRPA